MKFNQLPESVQYVLGAIAAALIIAAFIPYIIATVKKIITPHPLTWIGWALLIGTSFVSQVIEKGFELNQIPVCVSVTGCITIGSLSIKNGNIKPVDWLCLSLGILCAFVYITTKNPWLTTILAMVADTLVAIPTLHSAWINPQAEKSSAWKIGAVAYFITMIACVGHSWLYALFPIYLFFFNSTMVLLSSRKSTA